MILKRNLKSLFWCGEIQRIGVYLSKIKLIIAKGIE